MTHLVDAAIVLIGLSILGAFLMARRKRPYQPQYFESGPWVGMRDSTDAVDASPDRAKLIKNMMALSTPNGLAWVSRPGTVGFGESMGNKGQGLIHWKNATGTSYLTAVYAGEIYTFAASSTPSATKQVSTSDLTTASVTLSATARVSFAVLAGKLIISDGTNTPFTWDGSTGSSGLTSLTNCPVIYGPLTVYYSKLFGIKNSDRTTLVWSEENDPTLGYDASPYNNAWEFTQQNQEPMTCLLGTNEALYVFRRNSITEITGAVNDEFTTSGTRASVSESIGTASPWSVIFSERAIYFMDQIGRPHFFRIGGDVTPIWQDYRETLSTLNATALADMITVNDSLNQIVRFGIVTSGNTYPTRWLTYRIVDGSPIASGYWDGLTFIAAAEMVCNPYGLDSGVRPRIVHLHPTNGKAFAWRSLSDGASVQNDQDGATTTAIACEFQAQNLGGDVSGELYWDRIDWELWADNSGNSWTFNYYYVTPRGTSANQAIASPTSTPHQAVGINAHGRWLRPGISASVDAGGFGVTRVRARGVVTTDSPSNS